MPVFSSKMTLFGKAGLYTIIGMVSKALPTVQLSGNHHILGEGQSPPKERIHQKLLKSIKRNTYLSHHEWSTYTGLNPSMQGVFQQAATILRRLCVP